MAQGPNLRLVHCPKCASLLQELHDCSLFRCGACGAVLRAKKREPASDGGNSAETSESFGAAREQERGIHDRNVKNERLSSSGAGTDVSVSNSAMDKREESASARRDSASDESAGLRLDRRRAKEETAYAFDHKRYAEDRGNRFMERGFGESSARSKKVLDLASSRAERGRWSFAGDHLEVFLRDSRIVTEHEMTRRYRYPEEGTSDYYRSPSFGGYGEFLGRHSDMTDRDRVRELERKRVELLRKLDELANPTSRSGDIANKSGAGETVPRHERIASGDPSYAHAGYGVLDEPLIRDSPIGKPPDMKQGHESAHSMESYEMEMSAFYFSPWDGQLNLLEDKRRSFSPRTVRPFHRYAHEPPPGHLSDGYLGFDRDLPVMYPNRSPRHHPSCACSSCCYKYERVPPPRFSPNASSSSKTFEARFNSNLYHRVNPVEIRPQHARHSSDSTSSSNSKYLHSLQMWPEDPDLDIENFIFYKSLKY